MRSARRLRPKGRCPMRERLAIVFMTANVLATLVLGGAIAYDFSHRGGGPGLQPTAGAVAGQSYTSAPSSGSGNAAAPSGGATAGTPAPSNAPSSSGRPSRAAVADRG